MNIKKEYNNGRRDFSGVNLRHANLENANLYNANLGYANLENANLGYANLRNANFYNANLRYANLGYANLRYANLGYANLENANLENANFYNANLYNANLSNTILNSTNVPNGIVDEFEINNNWCIGYRTKKSVYNGSTEYIVGKWYKAPYFSTCVTECHPGLYVFPSIDYLKSWLKDRKLDANQSIVKVLFRSIDCHKADKKWRVTDFLVWEDV